MIKPSRTHDPAKICPIIHQHKHIVVCFADIMGFTHWTKSPLYSNSKFRRKIVDIYQQFVDFEIANNFFLKRMGDGIMYAIELDGNRTNNGKKAISMIRNTKALIKSMSVTIGEMEFPKPQGFRARMVAGDALRLETNIRGHKRFDYIGYPVNFSFHLLNVRPEIPFIAHETVKAIIGPEPAFINSIQIDVAEKNYKGVDREDLKSLWDFEFSK